MTLDKIHYFLDQITNKEISGYFTPEQKDAALERASMDRFAELVSEYGKTQRLQEDLAPFRVEYTFTNASSPAGVITLPSTFQQLLNVRIQGYDNDNQLVTYNDVDLVNDDEVTDRLKSQLIPLANNPIMQLKGKGIIQLWPKAASAGVVTYLKKPSAPVYGYTLVGRVVTYSSGSSTQMEWDDLNISKIILQAAVYLGVNMSADKVVQYSNDIKNAIA